MNAITRPLAVFCLLLTFAAIPGGVPAAPQAARGDANNDGSITLADAIYMVSYLFSKGPAPTPNLDAGDANCDGRIDFLDAIYLVNYTVRSGPSPQCPDNL